MTETLCVIDPCIIPKRHSTDGCDADCPGCLPGLAADGLLICGWHHRHGLRLLSELPNLDDDLGLALIPGGGGVRAWSPVTRAPGIDLDQNVIDARDYLRGRLAELVAYVVVERGLTIRPVGTVAAMTAFLTRHAQWMSANPVLAPIWTRQLENLRREAQRRAYRTRPTMKLGDCPLTKPDGSACGTAVRHDPSDYAGQKVTCRGCGTTGTVDWWQTTIWGDSALLPADAVARLLSFRYNRLVPPSTIRAWASKGIIRSSKDAAGRTVFDVTKVREHADTVWTPAAAQVGRTA